MSIKCKAATILLMTSRKHCCIMMRKQHKHGGNQGHFAVPIAGRLVNENYLIAGKKQ